MYNNKHLKEVVCTFRFPTGSKKWDSAYFGQMYDKIVGDGFTERQEKKGILFEMSESINSGGMKAPTIQEAQSQMIFRNLSKNEAITMGNEFVSFHRVSTYEGWENFHENMISIFMEKYIDLAIYDRIQSCQIVYLNLFNLPIEKDLSDYFTVISPPFKQFGTEVNVQIVKNYITSNNVVLNLKINSMPPSESNKNMMLECGATGKAESGISIQEWRKIANDVKQPIRDFFESIITDELRRSL